MKDNFSQQAKAYARFRPHYPQALFDHIYALAPAYNCAWDCGTGNGQVAGILANRFTKVFATDISSQQLAEAVQKPNIEYSLQPAEETGFTNNQFDLVMVAQAIHWFQFSRFYREVKRTLKPGGVFVVTGYGLLQTGGLLQSVIDYFYTGLTGPYWNKERVYIDEGYQTIPFPFTELPAPHFSMVCQWTFSELTGYFSTWSAVRHYIRKNNEDPVERVRQQLQQHWGAQEKRQFHFPLLLRIGINNF